MESTKKPYQALAAGIFLPGLGHLYAGDKRGAAFSFVAVTACFAVGLWLADWRVFAFSNSLFSGVFKNLPIHLLPEAVNFGETTVAWIMQPESADPDRARLLRLPISTEHLGLTLTGLSGYLNAILAADACWLVARHNLSEKRGRQLTGRPAISALLTWLVPGLGHAREGRGRIGALVGFGVIGIYVMGLWFSDFRGVDRSQLYWWWAGEAGFGGASLVLTPLLGPLALEHDVDTVDLGITLLCIAGLLNVVAMTQAYTLGEKRALDAEPGVTPGGTA